MSGGLAAVAEPTAPSIQPENLPTDLAGTFEGPASSPTNVQVTTVQPQKAYLPFLGLDHAANVNPSGLAISGQNWVYLGAHSVGTNLRWSPMLVAVGASPADLNADASFILMITQLIELNAAVQRPWWKRLFSR